MLPFLLMTGEDEPRQNTLEAIYKQHHQMMERTVACYLSRREDREDALQNACMQMIRVAEKLLTMPTEKQGVYLYIIARREAARTQRQRIVSETPERLEETAGTEPRPNDGDWELHLSLLDWMRALDAPDRELLLSCYVQEKSQSEIARELGVSRSTVTRRLRQLRSRLREQL